LVRVYDDLGGGEPGLRGVGTLLRHGADAGRILPVMSAIVASRPEDGWLQLLRGQVAIEAGAIEIARVAYGAATELLPEQIEPQLALADLLITQGQVNEALAGLRQVAARLPTQVEPRAALAQVLVQLGRLNEALVEYRGLTDLMPQIAEFWRARALLAMETKAWPEAEEALKRWAELPGQTEQSLFHQARLELQRAGDIDGNVTEARPRARRLLSGIRVDEGLRFEAQLLLLQMEVEDGRLDVALHRVQTLQTQSEDVDQWLRLILIEGEWWRERQRFDQAEAVFDRGLAQRPGEPDLFYARALARERQGKLDAAVEDLRAALAARPNHPPFLNALGYTLADLNRDLPEAERLIAAAMEADPRDPAYLDSLAWLRYRQGRSAEAEQMLRQALTAFPDAEIAAHLIEVLAVTGQAAEAAQLLQEWEARAPDQGPREGGWPRLRGLLSPVSGESPAPSPVATP